MRTPERRKRRWLGCVVVSIAVGLAVAGAAAIRARRAPTVPATTAGLPACAPVAPEREPLRATSTALPGNVRALVGSL